MAPRETRMDFYRLSVGVAGFLAGIMFAAMSMLIRFYEGMAHGELLIVLTAIDCVLFTLYAFGSVQLASVKSADAGRFAAFVHRIGSSAMWLFLAIVPILVLQVTLVGFLAVAAAEAVLVALYCYVVRRAEDADSAG